MLVLARPFRLPLLLVLPYQRVMRCNAIQLVQDTILVLQDRATEDNIHHFKAYSVNSSDYLGAFGRLGRGPGSSIHILDWNGDFLYDVRVDENIGDIAFDERTQRLYCIDRLEGGVVVYDLDALNLRSPLR